MRFKNIDQMRAIAALSVLLSHLTREASVIYNQSAHHPWLAHISQTIFLNQNLNLGRAGVIIFFLISGYLIPFSFSGTAPLRNFVISRVLRLYPLFWLSIAAFVAIAFFTGVATPVTAIVANATMIPDFIGSHRLMDVYWTLEIELLFYVVVGLMFLVLGPLTSRAARYAMISLFAVVIAISVFQAVGINLPAADRLILLGVMFLGSHFRKSQMEKNKPVDFYGCVGIALFLGALLARGYVHFTLNIYGDATSDDYSFTSHMISNVLALTLFLVFLSTRLNLSILNYAGLISYSIYIIHPIVMDGIKALDMAQQLADMGIYIPVAFMLSLGASAITYQLAEKPFVRLSRYLRDTWPTSQKKSPVIETSRAQV